MEILLKKFSLDTNKSDFLVILRNFDAEIWIWIVTGHTAELVSLDGFVILHLISILLSFQLFSFDMNDESTVWVAIMKEVTKDRSQKRFQHVN